MLVTSQSILPLLATSNLPVNSGPIPDRWLVMYTQEIPALDCSALTLLLVMLQYMRQRQHQLRPVLNITNRTAITGESGGE